MAYRLQTSWLDTAIEDPCLFHALFFGTSASIDISQGKPASSITLYHKTQAIRRIRRAITECDYKDIPPSVLAATLYLLYFTVGFTQITFINNSLPLLSKLINHLQSLNGDVTEGIAHERGLDAILRRCKYESSDPGTFFGYLFIS